MSNDKLRRQIAFEAARLMYSREESEYFRAKKKAARRLGQGWVKPADLPSNAEVRDQVQAFARMHEGPQRDTNLRDMRIQALRIMRLLTASKPRLIGSVLTGHVRDGSDIDIHVFVDNLTAATSPLEDAGLEFDVEHKRVRKDGEERVFTHIHLQDEFPVELTVYASSLTSYPFRSSITGKPIERASIAELEDLLAREYPELSEADAIDHAVEEAGMQIDRFEIYRLLLAPLEGVKQNPKWHPEGDALYHSLQVFELARDAAPYDEEVQTAALLHDVGKGIDPRDHIRAALEALEGYVTPRTAWLIEHHMEAGALRDGTIGVRARRRLEAHEDFDDLMTLCDCDRGGRERGVATCDLDDALEHLRELARICE